MRYRLAAIFSLLLLVSCASSTGEPAPRLVVLIGIDQLRAEYLDRLDPMFTSGFRRLKDEGWWFQRGLVDHAPTLSLPGHTTLATGTSPRTHGIVANDWVTRTDDGGYARTVAVMDPDHPILGHPDSPGVSPRNIRVTGLADWLRAADPNARTVAVSTGPYLSMLYGGRAQEDRSRNHVYWLSRGHAEFVTSTYYRDEVPDWIREFNRTELADARRPLVWETSVPEAYRALARRDDAPYEGDEAHVSFPHSPGDLSGDVTPDVEKRWYASSPLADDGLFALARRSVLALSLGQRRATDFLAVAVKSVDRVGHDFGPHSQEQLDVIHRLDGLLGDFLAFLDETVGPDRYVVAVSADHGAPNVTEFELEEGRHARRVSEEDFKEVLAGVKALVEGHDGPEGELPALIAAELERADFIARAMTPEDLSGSGPVDDAVRLYRNSYDPSRSNLYPLWTMEILRGTVDATHPANFGVSVELEYQANIWSASSTHGSAHDYDRQVPILFLGKGVPHGRSEGPARTVDVAPTLAHLAGVPTPATVEGRVLDLRRP